MFGSHLKPEHDTVDESTTSGSNTSRLAIIGLVLALVAAVGWFGLKTVMDTDTSSALDGPCTTTTVKVVAAPAMADLVQAAADALPDNGQCISVDVVTATVSDVAKAQADVRDGDADVFPDLWVPDSPAWQTVLTSADRTGAVLVPALATTPVAFASGRSDQPASWLEVLASPRLVMSDPNASGASAMALVTPFAEGDATAAQNEIVPVAQQFGDDVSSGVVVSDTVDTLAGGSDKLIPVTEQDFLIAQRGNPALKWVAPSTGVGVLDFPLVQPTTAAGSGQALDVAGRTGDRLAEWFTTDEGKAAVEAEKLRGPDGAALPDGDGISDEKQLPDVDKVQVDAVIKSWNGLIVPSSIIALFDTSESMANSFGDTTRIQLAVDASLTALDVFPDAVRLGIRSFSTKLEPGGQDWRELAPLRRLDAPVSKGQIQIDLLRNVAGTLPKQTGGGSGLYDSILDAYQEAVLQYNPYYSNNIVVFTDGPNEDPGSISLDGLKRKLKTLYDPERPVRMILIGLSEDADLASLQEIATTAEKSAAFLVNKPEEILLVLASALLSRE